MATLCALTLNLLMIDLSVFFFNISAYPQRLKL
jgi:hypothetical protein